MRNVDELEERLSRPRPALIEDIRKINGDILVLGASGKLGPSLVRLATRAMDEAGAKSHVIAVSRYSDPTVAERIRQLGAKVVKADVTDESQLLGLPDAENVIFLVGAKFGTSGNESDMWFTNTHLPARVAARFKESRIAALSSGNVYPLWPTSSNGPTENDPVDPVGEYAMSCLGRERILAHVAAQNGTPMAFLRLNYAAETRYGVLVDIARAVSASEPVDLTTGHANVVWQGYANEVTIRSLLRADVPPFVLNVTGPEKIMVRQVAEDLGRKLGRDVTFTGTESATALLSNAANCHRLFGYPDVTPTELIDYVATWVSKGLPSLGKPTKFQRRDGRF